MTFLEAAEAVLRAERKPLTVREITEIALRHGLLETHGKTPEATMSAALYGASPDGPIRRRFVPGPQRAIRGSVRWFYVGNVTSPGNASFHGEPMRRPAS
jgi:HB1, ASXL, restriction endonuclease HTH domain